jgi:hypothetical protein
VVVRITGWVDRRFDSDAPLWRMLREPEHHLVASPLAEGCVAVEERWSDSASRELMARRYLDGRERATYEGLNPRAQRAWLLGRIAAKDAVRHRLWAAGHGPLFPIEVPLVDDGDRAVRVADGPAAGTRVALAVVPWAAAAGAGIPAIDLVAGAGDIDEARRGLEKELAARTPPGATVRCECIRSPFYDNEPSAEAPPGAATEHNERKEYAVAWSQPEG